MYSGPQMRNEFYRVLKQGSLTLRRGTIFKGCLQDVLNCVHFYRKDFF